MPCQPQLPPLPTRTARCTEMTEDIPACVSRLFVFAFRTPDRAACASSSETVPRRVDCCRWTTALSFTLTAGFGPAR